MILFNDRKDAANQLAEPLKAYQNQKDTIVIAIPRGGVEIGAELAKQLFLPLDVFFVKKISHPDSPEFAIGAVSSTSALIENNGVSKEYLNQETIRIQNALIAKEQLYRKAFKPLDLKNKTVILVDDGVATGNTLILTARLIRALHPHKIVIAIPVGPKEAQKRLKAEADEVIFLHTPANFFSIGQFYQDFAQVEDAQAIQLLRTSHGYTN
jgi:predicted phosphoribosyltransferase